MNQLYQQLMGNQSSQNNQLINLFKSSKNPQQLIMNMAQTNPQARQILDMVSKSGQSPKDLFYTLARQKGVDPNQILNMLK